MHTFSLVIVPLHDKFNTKISILNWKINFKPQRSYKSKKKNNLGCFLFCLFSNLPISTESEHERSSPCPLCVHSGPPEKAIVRVAPSAVMREASRRSRSCCLWTPGRAGCHQVDKVSHFARRQDYSQGQRLKWLLFELQSPKHSHTARRRERHMRASPFTMPIPFRIHCLHRDHSIAAAEHTHRQQAPCERQNTRRYSRFSLLYTKLLFEEMWCQLCYDTARAEYKIYLIFLFY